MNIIIENMILKKSLSLTCTLSFGKTCFIASEFAFTCSCKVAIALAISKLDFADGLWAVLVAIGYNV